jgi:hypothetical protein
MKNSLIQAIIGFLIIASPFFYFSYIFDGYYAFYSVDPATGGIYRILIHWPAVAYPSNWAVSCLVLGLAISGCGLGQLFLCLKRKITDKETRRIKSLALIQSGLGILLIGLFVWYLVGIETRFPFPEIASDQKLGIFRDAKWTKMLLSWKVINLLFGVILIALGLNQARRIKTQ